MELELPKLRREERATLQIRALFEREGYRLHRMGSFEEYDFYMQNRPFLQGEDVISFTGPSGRLMALKPDVTLSIVKNTPAGQMRRLYYNEQVYRRSRQTGEYREIRQMGLEFIGGEGQEAEAEVLCLAGRSLAVIGAGMLDLSHMGFIEAMLAPFGAGEGRDAALNALQSKSPHAMRAAAGEAGLPAETGERLARFCTLTGPYAKAVKEARALAAGVPEAESALDELDRLAEMTAQRCPEVALRLDFSILNDVSYYNGLVFQGFVQGVSRAVLSGGRYDSLMQRFAKTQGGLGFALYLDAIGPAADEAEVAEEAGWLNVALPKGRMGRKVYALMERAGLVAGGVLDEESRKLVFEDTSANVRFFMVKPTDVDIYVEHGAADIGVVGRDVLLESEADVLELLDLGLGACRLAVAGREGFTPDPARALRVASKYPHVARSYYAQRSQAVEVIELHGSVELAPLIGLADVIVDIVETGSTLVENDLAVLAEVEPSSARLIANRASWRFKGKRIREVLTRLAEVLAAQDED